MKHNTRLYVAYGSNLNLEQMKYRCPQAKVYGTAFIADYQLMFKGSKTGSYLTIEQTPTPNGVPVAIWEVSATDEDNLDWYEGYPTFYYKKNLELDITRTNGKVEPGVPCFVYIMHEERKCGLPSKGYLNGCADGYQSFGFDTAYLSEALEYTAKNI